jgi:copper oxidase (laccase) domain-containing protein
VEATIHPFETFPGLSGVAGWTRHAFVQRVPGIDTEVDRDEALRRLEGPHQNVMRELGFSTGKLCLAEQVHGSGVADVGPAAETKVFGAVDGLITVTLGVLLGIYVADCCAIYVADPIQHVIALLHSGKKGTELGILEVALEQMNTSYGTQPENVVVQLSPCIRPPAYEVDFAATIREQALAAGVPAGQVHDDRRCTASNADRYYSYRTEKGKTGRMLALFGLPE